MFLIKFFFFSVNLPLRGFFNGIKQKATSKIVSEVFSQLKSERVDETMNKSHEETAELICFWLAYTMQNQH
jgi:hypothetical protein